MINSMTGFGRYESITDECRISVEIKAVNHRYLDLGIKMPKKFNAHSLRIIFREEKWMSLLPMRIIRRSM